MELQVKLCHRDAVVPTKAHPDDTGYDITIVGIDKILSSDSIMYDTGVAICPPDGYYTEVVPRSSFAKTGFIFPNCVGIIDSNYRGTIKIVLKGKNELPLPYKGFQLILRKREEATFRVVEELNDTLRGDGGFGSTS